MAEEQNKLSLNLRQEVSSGSYSNLAVISHSKTEFILDFASMLPGLSGPEVVSRIIMNPEHAKRLLVALQDNIGKYEGQFGAINIGAGHPAKGTFNLGDLPGFGQFGGNGAKS